MATPPSSADPAASTNPAVAPRRCPVQLIVAMVIGGLQAAGFVAYAIAIAVTVAIGAGSEVAAAPVEIIIYLLFAAGIALIVRALGRQRAAARVPYVVTQAFGLIIGWTLTSGDGSTVLLLGWTVLVTSVVALALMLSRPVGEALSD